VEEEKKEEEEEKEKKKEEEEEVEPPKNWILDPPLGVAKGAPEPDGTAPPPVGACGVAELDVADFSKLFLDFSKLFLPY
jgi:hypothetical protein